MTGSFDTSELLQQLDKLNQSFQSSHWVISSRAAMIGFAFLISLLSFAIWKKCCGKSSPDTPVLPGPSAPPAPGSTGSGSVQHWHATHGAQFQQIRSSKIYYDH